MKADVQKPIQSLHSFGRHYSGGSFAALPPIFIIRDWMVITACVLFSFVTLLSAQQSDSNQQITLEEKKLDLLFDKIMQTMPEEIKEKVDSAGSYTLDQRVNTTSVKQAEQLLHVEKTATEQTIHDLPDEVKANVERTINDIQQRKEERKAQFRESHKRHP